MILGETATEAATQSRQLRDPLLGRAPPVEKRRRGITKEKGNR